MELKHLPGLLLGLFEVSLNRTFYGIETEENKRTHVALNSLNRTFYGIETRVSVQRRLHGGSLNRTFYGIETQYRLARQRERVVLIVPFMELKRLNHPTVRKY